MVVVGEEGGGRWGEHAEQLQTGVAGGLRIACVLVWQDGSCEKHPHNPATDPPCAPRLLISSASSRNGIQLALETN